jgi:hypothetical protein
MASFFLGFILAALGFAADLNSGFLGLADESEFARV